MTAEPLGLTPGPIERPRTVGAVRRALPADLRAAFQTALDDAAPEELFSLVARWAAVAQTATDPDAQAAADAVRAGTATTYEIGEVFPSLAGML